MLRPDEGFVHREIHGKIKPATKFHRAQPVKTGLVFFMGSITGLAAIQGVTDFQEVYQRIFFGGRQFYRIAIVIGRGLVS